MESADKKLIAIEVKSGTIPHHRKGMEMFEKQFQLDLKRMVGEGGILVEDFLSNPMSFGDTILNSSITESSIEHVCYCHCHLRMATSFEPAVHELASLR